MKNTCINFIAKNENCRLAEEVGSQISRKFYRNLKANFLSLNINGEEGDWNSIVHCGDAITIYYMVDDEIDWPLYPSKLDVIFEDDNYLIVNKRKELLSIPTKGEPYSLYQEVLYYLKSTNQELNCSLLNRLDKDTRGLVLVAKNRLAAYYMSPTHEHMERRYLCLCEGIFDVKSGTIKTFIDKLDDSHTRVISHNSGKIAISHYRVIEEYKNSSLVEFVLETGRTHQIRLHTKYLSHPILGDILYGNGEYADGLELCSYKISFIHPFTNEKIEFEIKPNFIIEN